MFCAGHRDHATFVEDVVVVNGLGRWARDVARPVRLVLNEDEARAVKRVIAAGCQEVDQSACHARPVAGGCLVPGAD